MTGISGYFCFISARKSSPEPLGMRMSLTTTCGCSWFSAFSASGTDEKVLNSKSVRASAFSNTQRIDLSSSKIQIGFILFSTLRNSFITVIAGLTRNLALSSEMLNQVQHDNFYCCAITACLITVLSTGSKIVKQVSPGLLWQSIMPWCWVINVCAKASPRPLPPSRPVTKG